MRKPLYIILCVALIAAAFVGGAIWKSRKPSVAGADARKILYYVDPMNPAHTSDKPGLAPCGMQMEPVYADAAGAPAQMLPLLPGTVKITPEKLQLMGVQTGTVERKGLTHTLRLLGKVAVDETRFYRINATVDGWVTDTRPVATGSLVKKDETLGAFYSVEFLSAAQALLFALNSKDRAQTAAMAAEMTTMSQTNRVTQFNINIQQYRDTLHNLGMSELQIEEMIHTRKFTPNIRIVSPADGFITARNISEGLRFEKGTELFRIADLSRVWILADAFEKDAALIPASKAATVSLPNQNRRFTVQPSDVLPQFDGVTRTLKFRFDADNPEFALRPDMFVDVEIPVTLPETLVVPADAVLDAGLRQTVFVDRGNGFFEPRAVQTGRRFGGQVQILHGLMAGERIVISGNFLLDSESRMKLAAAGVYGARIIDPVCGMAVDEQKATAANRKADFEGKTYFFCNDGCKEEFVANPRKFLNSAAPPAHDTSAPPSVTGTNDAPHRDQPHH